MALLKTGRKIKLADRQYEITGFLGQGGSGEVYKVLQADRHFAMKVFFPFYQRNLFGASSADMPRLVKESLEFQKKEYEFLSRIDHPNIVSVHDSGETPLTAAEQKLVPVKHIERLPVLITAFVDGRGLKDALSEFNLSGPQFARALHRLALALEYLHADRQYMHADIKSSNVLIRRADFEPVLIDFALCKNLNFDEVLPNETTRLLGDWDLFPKELPTEHRLKSIKEAEGTRQELRALAFPFLDLFQVGKLLKSLRPYYSPLFDSRDLSFLEMLAEQLTDWEVVIKWGPRDLAQRIARLGPEHFAAFGVPELTSPESTARTIVIPPAVGVPATKRIEDIVDTRSFRRLATINQLCLLSYVYPGADYKRMVHVLFAYDLARQFVIDLYGSPLFRILFDTRRAQQLLVSVLLHDINHFPFLHIFQESEIPGLDRLQVVDLFCNGEATGERAAGRPSIYDLLGDVGIEPDRFKRIVFGNHHEQAGTSVEVDQAISSLINSAVDVDKLSYLFLDSHFTGVRYGAGIDFSCLLKAATLGRLEPGKAVHLAFTDRALQALENVVMTRFWNFRSLYWHHTNRGIMAMILDVVRKLYVDQGRNVHEYLLDTMWRNDAEVVRYLDAKYQAQLSRPSILAGLIEDRSRLYKRLYTVRAGMGDDVDNLLYSECRKFDFQAEKCFRSNLAEALRGFLGLQGGAAVTQDEVLIDIPRRDMDSGGEVFVSDDFGSLKSLSTLSDPVHAVNANYERLTKRIRYFVSPRVAAVVEDRRKEQRKQLQGIIKDALDATRRRSEVQ